jgi:recombinational DNA repair protein RecT
MNDIISELKHENEVLKSKSQELDNIIYSNAPTAKKIRQLFNVQEIAQQFLMLIPDIKNQTQILAREVSSLCLDINADSDLQQCTFSSILSVLKETLSRGLRIGKAHKEAYIVSGNSKENDKWVKKAQLRLGYHAYINKAYSDYNLIFDYDVVCKEEVEKGLFDYDHENGKIVHKFDPKLETKIKTRENIVFAYVKATNEKTGYTKHSRPYTKEELEERAKQVKRKGNNKEYYWGSVWKSEDRATDYSEMLKKTAITLFCKSLPQQSLNELASFEYQNDVSENYTENDNQNKRERKVVDVADYTSTLPLDIEETNV